MDEASWGSVCIHLAWMTAIEAEHALLEPQIHSHVIDAAQLLSRTD